MRFIRKFFLLILLLALLAGGITTLIARYYNYSTGIRVGTIIKFSEKGFVFKTNEGTLNTGEIMDGKWFFTVRDSETKVLEQITKAQEGGNRVSLYYNEKIIQLPWFGDTKYFVDSVSIINP
jgi:hypothetical protein